MNTPGEECENEERDDRAPAGASEWERSTRVTRNEARPVLFVARLVRLHGTTLSRRDLGAPQFPTGLPTG
ncbi:MAG: hypothetical protein U0527_03765 [Candidatus Eisenbacteria bacterium]